MDFGILIQAQKIQKTLKHKEMLTVSVWSKSWLKHYIVEREPTNNTIKNRKYGLGIILNKFGGFTLPEVTSGFYQELLYNLKEEGKSRSTITAVHTVASLVFKHAKRNGLIEFNPTADAVIPKDKKVARKKGEKKQVLPKFLRRTN